MKFIKFFSLLSIYLLSLNSFVHSMELDVAEKDNDIVKDSDVLNNLPHEIFSMIINLIPINDKSYSYIQKYYVKRYNFAPVSEKKTEIEIENILKKFINKLILCCPNLRQLMNVVHSKNEKLMEACSGNHIFHSAYEKIALKARDDLAIQAFEFFSQIKNEIDQANFAQFQQLLDQPLLDIQANSYLTSEQIIMELKKLYLFLENAKYLLPAKKSQTWFVCMHSPTIISSVLWICYFLRNRYAIELIDYLPLLLIIVRSIVTIRLLYPDSVSLNQNCVNAIDAKLYDIMGDISAILDQ